MPKEYEFLEFAKQTKKMSILKMKYTLATFLQAGKCV
jgi:hypothetical protein